MSVDFVLLGGIEARVDGVPVDLGHVRQRSVLAGLLVDANAPVPTARLVDRVWGDRPPQRAHATLYSYVSRLRGALAAATQDVRITRRTGAYVLTVDPSAVDVHPLPRPGRAGPTAGEDRAATLFAQALALWRGDAFGDLDVPWFNALRASWHRERHAAELDLTDVRLRLGRHAELLAELPARTERHPLDERLAGQLMLALYRGGRRADALAHYQYLQRRLSAELGAEPRPGATTAAPADPHHGPRADPPPRPRSERAPPPAPGAAPVAVPARPLRRPDPRDRRTRQDAPRRRRTGRHRGDLHDRRDRRHRQDLARPALGPPQRRGVPRRPALRRPPRLLPGRGPRLRLRGAAELPPRPRARVPRRYRPTCRAGRRSTGAWSRTGGC
ncbi:AfsR/SARP family transcriptional regulator [Streptomyces tricolor]|nr:AfsR/SARP family transcriptional regulator [Streptomyces tricolor]